MWLDLELGVIKLKWGCSDRLWSHLTCALRGEGDEDTDSMEAGPDEDTGRSPASAGQGERPQKEVTLPALILDFQPSQRRENELLSFKLPSLWNFVMAVLANHCSHVPSPRGHSHPSPWYWDQKSETHLIATPMPKMPEGEAISEVLSADFMQYGANPSILWTLIWNPPRRTLFYISFFFLHLLWTPMKHTLL